MAKALMILGTASDIGRSVIAAGLCRVFYRAGITVAPFKAQNVSLVGIKQPRKLLWN